MIEALMLFGSAARGDANEHSDVDLLAVISNQKPFSKKTYQAEFQFFSPEDLLKSASKGELFAIHLAFEGKIIYDTSGIFSKFKESLIIRRSYRQEVRWGGDLAWFLHDFGIEKKASLVNKRVAWCVRTIAIANLVENGRNIFAPRLLASEYPHPYVADLIGLRRSITNNISRKRKLRNFLESIDFSHPPVISKKDFISYFKKTNNQVALHTIKNLQSQGFDHGYS